MQQASDREGNPLGYQRAPAAHNIVPVDDDGDDGGIGRGATDAFFFQRLDEACLGIPGRGLGRVGFGQHIADGQRLPQRNLRQQGVILGVALGSSVLVVAFLVSLEETAFGEHSSRGSELGRGEVTLGQWGCLEGDRDSLALRVNHLAGDGALPDQVVELQLVGAQNARERRGSSEAIAGWANGFVSFLSILGLALIKTWLTRNRLCTIELCGCSAGSTDRLGGERDGVRPHISDVTVFIKALGDAHRLLGRET